MLGNTGFRIIGFGARRTVVNSGYKKAGFGGRRMFASLGSIEKHGIGPGLVSKALNGPFADHRQSSLLFTASAVQWDAGTGQAGS